MNECLVFVVGWQCVSQLAAANGLRVFSTVRVDTRRAKLRYKGAELRAIYRNQLSVIPSQLLATIAHYYQLIAGRRLTSQPTHGLKRFTYSLAVPCHPKHLRGDLACASYKAS